MNDIDDLLQHPMPELPRDNFITDTLGELKTKQRRFRLVRFITLTSVLVIATLVLLSTNIQLIESFVVSVSLSSLTEISIKSQTLPFVVFFFLLSLFYLIFDALDLN